MDDEIWPLGVHDRLDQVVVRNRWVVLARECDLDQRQLVKTALELRQLGLGVLAGGLTQGFVSGRGVGLYLAFVSLPRGGPQSTTAVLRPNLGSSPRALPGLVAFP